MPADEWPMRAHTDSWSFEPRNPPNALGRKLALADNSRQVTGGQVTIRDDEFLADHYVCDVAPCGVVHHDRDRVVKRCQMREVDQDAVNKLPPCQICQVRLISSIGYLCF